MIESTPSTDVHNVQVLDAIPLETRKIVEVGTGTGALARQVATKLTGIDYIGVEISEGYGKSARNYCTRVYIENFESASEKLMSELQDTDIVIFADVLEHFIDPWSCLKRIRQFMPMGSSVIASIPNIQHWSVQYRLMAGDFQYADTGLLDRTHLRFFTRTTILEMFEKAGYTITQIVPRIFDFPQQSRVLSAIGQTAQTLGLSSETAIDDAAVFQYVIAASLANKIRPL